HRIVIEGDGVVIAALQRPDLRPAAVGKLRGENIIQPARKRRAPSGAVRGVRRNDVRQKAQLGRRCGVVERADVAPACILRLVKIVGASQSDPFSAPNISPGARTCCVKSVFLLQPPAGVWNDRRMSAMRRASSPPYQSAVRSSARPFAEFILCGEVDCFNPCAFSSARKKSWSACRWRVEFSK